MNDLEHCVIRACSAVHERYSDMAGYWLWHAPESFLQVGVATAIAKRGYGVYVDASRKKVLRDIRTPRGPVPDLHGRRHDISVWSKSTATLRAVIEIKHAWSIWDLRNDVTKVRRSLALACGARSGYVLAYSERKKPREVDQLFARWSNELDAELLHSLTRAPRGEKWSWGFALLRVG